MLRIRHLPNFCYVVAIILVSLLFWGPNLIYFNSNKAYAQTGSPDPYAPTNPPSVNLSLAQITEALQDATPGGTDTDGDGLYDSVEVAIGTDPEEADTDLDRLYDYDEIMNGLDPRLPDSNQDGLPDYLELNGVELDVDGDGIPNAWDSDNDGDGVNDGADLSPFDYSGAHDALSLAITTEAHGPVTITYQIRPENPAHLKFYGQYWDWPDTDRDGQMQDRDDSKEDIHLIPSLRISPVPPSLIPGLAEKYGITIDGDSAYVPLVPVTDKGTVVAFTGTMVCSAAAALSSTTSLVWHVIGTTDPEGSAPQSTQLASYNENFILTGLTVSESHGAGAGVFHSTDKNQTMAANLVLAYEFLRTGQSISEMGGVLSANGVAVESQTNGSFDHRDDAVDWLTADDDDDPADDVLPAVIDSLPPDQSLPVIIAIEDRSTTIDMSDLQGSGSSFTADLTQEPVITAKSLRTPWYNTSNSQVLSEADVAAEVEQLGLAQGLDDQALIDLMTMALYWNTGEETLSGPGIEQPDYANDFTVLPTIVNQLAEGSLSGFSTIRETSFAYRAIRQCQKNGFNMVTRILVGPSQSEILLYPTKTQQVLKMCDNVKTTVKWAKYLETTGKVLEYAALAFDLGFFGYNTYQIFTSDLISAYQWNAFMQVYWQAAIDIMLFAIAFIPVVGWAIAASLAISDAFLGWSSDLSSWISDTYFGADVDWCPTPSMEIPAGGGLSITTDEFKVGSTIGLEGRIRSKLKLDFVGSHGLTILLDEPEGRYIQYSTYVPSYQIQTDNYLYLILDQLAPPAESSWTTTYSGGMWGASNYSKAVEYDVDGQVQLQKAMVNCPIWIRTKATYHLYFECSFYILGLFRSPYPDEMSGWNMGDSFPLYVDVLPASIDEFASWRAISSLDHDGDGLKDIDETQTDPWKFDSDGDGLNDNYEIDIGTNPQTSDTDLDGLNDRFELQYGTDPAKADTDGDGLTDYAEITGWLVKFDYLGDPSKPFVTRVSSNPCNPDSDGDGVNDKMEYFSGLNPASKDTDADGTADVANPAGELGLELENSVQLPSPLEDIVIDKDGNVHALAGTLYKYDSDLNYITEWSSVPADALSLADSNDYLFVGVQGWYVPSEIVRLPLDYSSYETTPCYGAFIDIFTESPQDLEVFRIDLDPAANVHVLARGSWDYYYQGDTYTRPDDLFAPPGGVPSGPTYQTAKIFEPCPAPGVVCGAWGHSSSPEVLREEFGWPASCPQYNYYDFDCYGCGDPLGPLGDFNFVNEAVGCSNRVHRYRNLADMGALNYCYSDPEIWTSGTQCNFTLKDICEGMIEWGEASSEDFQTFCYNTEVTPDGLDLGARIIYLMGQHFDSCWRDHKDEFEIFIDLAYDLSDASAFTFVSDFAIDNSGYYYVTDTVSSVAHWYSLGGTIWDVTYDLTTGRIAKYDSSGAFVGAWSAFTDPDTGEAITLLDPSGIVVAPDGFLYVADDDGTRILKVDPANFIAVAVWDDLPACGKRWLDVDAEGNIYTSYPGGIAKYSQTVVSPYAVEDPNPDTDGDGLENTLEEAGWDITVTTANPGTHTMHVTSDPLLNDTDFDGLSDYEEWVIKSDPRNSDSDGDGISDAQEVSIGLDQNNYDTDGDGLSDSVEIANGSDPIVADTDGDGLTDLEEYNLGSDPANPDTDGDGLSDSEESAQGADLLSADTDNDGLLDGQEVLEGSDPNNADSDGDGLNDGIEIMDGTNPNNGDTDGDGISDGDEVEQRLDPTSADTDNDGVPDGTELAEGLNPFTGDSDNDGLSDAQELAEGTNPIVADTDGDGVPDGMDSAPQDDTVKWDPEQDQTDSDGDGLPDYLDECPTDPNKGDPGVCGCGVADDADNDLAIDCIESCPTDPNKTEPGICGCGIADTDSDGDGTPDCIDPCPADANKTEPGACGCGVVDTDSDGDGTPDCIDACPTDANKIDPGICGCGVVDTDSDSDGTPDCTDECPLDPGKIEPGICGCGVADSDSDGDGTPDCIDACPTDSTKVEPGICGCGTVDTDTDSDGAADCNDGCPTDANKVEPGICGCGVGDIDTDGDGAADCNDSCPVDPNKIDPGICGCGVADTDSDGDGTPDCLDGCPTDANKVDPGVCGCGVVDADSDGDGTADCVDLCPTDPNKTQPGICGCGVVDVDTDGDFTADCIDGCPTDSNKAEPGVCGCGVADADTDNDGTLDCNDPCPLDPENDVDSDGVCASDDNCPAAANPTQADADGDSVGDACDACTDTDADGYGNPGYTANTCAADNCPDISNADQANFDGDEMGDACDPDDDNDGVVDESDQCKEEDATGFDANNDGCIDTLTGLTVLVTTLATEAVIDETIENSTLSKVANAQKSADKANICAAVNQLRALQNEVNAQREKKISVSAANLIISYVENVISGLLNQLPDGESC